MRMGFQTKNLAKGNITIDSSLRAYVYMGKYLIPNVGIDAYVDFPCNGVPQVYFEVPYNVTSQDAGVTGLNSFRSRTGINLNRLEPIGAGLWRAHVAVNVFNGPPLNLHLRVFGRLDLNPPPPPYGYGLMVRTLSGEMVFYSGKRMLRLAGDTYDVELVLPWQTPQTEDSFANSQDTFVNLPFNMQGKSISANTRGTVSTPYYLYSYNDDGQIKDRYAVLRYQTMYWANGNQLQIRRIAPDEDEIDSIGALIIDNSRCQTVYSRLSVIDNAQFP
ncbi:hypothetical protein ACWYXK_13955 [Janthinobacterium lividum]